jgi:hypothetical protein
MFWQGLDLEEDEDIPANIERVGGGSSNAGR